MQAWQLPEYIADVLPSAALRLERAKESLLTLFRVHGYEPVIPPMMEYTQSLLTHIDAGLADKTIRISDRFSGLQVGLRADITPQISRIDAHLLGRNSGVNRLCYAGTVLHARPDTLYSTREPLQVGAELYGFAGIEADLELIALMLDGMAILGVERPLLSLGHIAVFRALTANLSPEDRDDLLAVSQTKNAEAAAVWCKAHGLGDDRAAPLVALTSLYGDPDDVLARADRALPDLPGIRSALGDLRVAADFFRERDIHLDLAELRADRYHSGLLFAAYRKGDSDAVARGGRYDGLGQYFGRARPASGFSFDLKNFLPSLPQKEEISGICVAAGDAVPARAVIADLRAKGEKVVIDYLGEGATGLRCDRVLRTINGQWQVLFSEE